MSMRFMTRRKIALGASAVCLLLLCYTLLKWQSSAMRPEWKASKQPAKLKEPKFRWDQVTTHYPVTSVMIPLPSGRPAKIPRIQHRFNHKTSTEAQRVRASRLEAVQHSFAHAWKGYKQHAWLADEVSPVSGGFQNGLGGWAATLVDTLDTLWIMGLYNDFEEAVSEVALIDFSTSSEAIVLIFEITIRHLGGLLSAYDLSGHRVLLDKAIELGEMLYVAFDTPNRMPVTRWNWESAAKGEPQEALEWIGIAEIGSLTLEFTRLSQLSKDPKYFDAVQRISDHFYMQQNHTKLPGMWPLSINSKTLAFEEDNTFSVGAMSDSMYEYLPKQFVMLGGLEPRYREMYEGFVNVMKARILFRPLNQGNLDILLPGNGRVNDGKLQLDPQGQHLVCFAGGMVGIAAKIFDRAEDLDTARKLVDGCIWAYETMPTGVMPETFHAIPCAADDQWNETEWHRGILSRQDDPSGTASDHITKQRLQPGITAVGDRRYILRPEAIESIFIMYRITGDTTLQDKAWKMFEAIEKYTRTEIAHSAIDDVTTVNPAPLKLDKMESFWTAETLKYFYLIFSEPDVISLDEYVFNTEAHPLKRPQRHGIWRWF